MNDSKVCPWTPTGEPPGTFRRKHHMYFVGGESAPGPTSTYRCKRCGYEETIETPTIDVTGLNLEAECLP